MATFFFDTKKRTRYQIWKKKEHRKNEIKLNQK